MHPNVAGALLNSALYLLCVFVAGMVSAHPMAWKLAIATMGLTFFCNVAGIADKKSIALYLMVLSWVIGALAGIALLV